MSPVRPLILTILNDIANEKVTKSIQTGKKEDIEAALVASQFALANAYAIIHMAQGIIAGQGLQIRHLLAELQGRSFHKFKSRADKPSDESPNGRLT